MSPRVNYELRPNKNVERKIFVEILRQISVEFDLEDYSYIGMGSLWFIDFKLMHRAFGFHDMVSIESVPRLAERARFNQPFDCVRVKEGESTIVLREMNLRAGRSIIWLDHELGISGGVLDDVKIVAQRVPSGSIFAVTVKADHRDAKDNKGDDGRTLEPTDWLRNTHPGLAPDVLSEDDFTVDAFPALLCGVIESAVRSALIRAGRTEKWLPIFSFAYKDGARMITVGGMIGNVEDEARLGRSLRGVLAYVNTTDSDPFPINVPMLTIKEKAALDRLLPAGAGLSPELVKAKLDISLKETELESYERFYREYPVFSETVS